MNRPRTFSALLSGVLLALPLWAVAAPTPDTPSASPATPPVVVAQAAVPAVQSANIFEVKPEASEAPGYATQTNGQRAQVQPGNNAPMWRAVGAGTTGYSSLPVTQAPEAGNLIQPFVQYPGSSLTNAGEAWRQVRNNWILPYGGSLLLIAVLALAIFYKTKGVLGGHLPDTGKKIERFTPFERAAHWANAGAFVALAVSGIVMAFGKFFIYPVIGGTLFGWLAYVLKNVHNFVGPLFAVSLVIVIVTFVKDNIANAADWIWLKKAGGMLGDHEIPSHRFNAGEKGMFWWGVCFPGLVVVASGLVLDKLVPGLGVLRGEMHIAHMIHAVAAVLMMTMLIGHIYMGTIGVKGALGAMKTGYVDEGWAKENHELWYNDIKAGKIPAQRSVPQSAAAPTSGATASV